MAVNLVRNAKLNAISSYVYFAAGAVITFFISPLLIAYLGANIFGIWKTVQKFLDFASVIDGRPSQALKWVIANKEGQSDNTQKQQAVGSALGVCLLFLPLLLLVVAVLVYLLPSLINGLQSDQLTFVRYVGFILGANIILGPLLAIPDSILVGSNQAYRSTVIRTFWLICSNAAILYLAYSGHSLISFAAVILVTAVLNAVSTYLIAAKFIPWLGVLRPVKTQFKEFLGFSSWVLLWSFVAKTLLASELLLLSYLVGAESVSSYVFSTYVTQLGLAVALMTASALTPGLGRLLGEANYLRSRDLIAQLRDINLLIAVVIGGGVLMLNESFITLWVGSEFYLGKLTNLLIVIAFVQLVLLRGEGQIQDLSLKIKNKVLLGLLSTILSISLALIFYNLSNQRIPAIFIGIIAGRLLMSVLFPIMVNAFSGCQRYPSKQYVFACLILLACYLVSDYIAFQFWWSFALGAFFIGSGLAVLSYLLLLRPQFARASFK